MDLILWRHCDAEAGAPDELRRLTPLGLQQAAWMAQWLAQRLPDGCRIVVSPAVRAQQTAQALDRRFRTVRAIGPGASAAALLGAVDWPAAGGSVLVVAHQPTLGRVASLLLDGEECDRAMDAGAIAWLASRPFAQPARAILKAAIGPGSV
jgi:phosphohistidine phosphatase